MKEIHSIRLARAIRTFAILLPAFLMFVSLSYQETQPQSIESDNASITSADDTTLVFVYEIFDEIARPIWRTTMEAFSEADDYGADYILIHINTYGGLVDIADSIRTKILNSAIPVLAFIDNQAISAGALISIACDSIYMRPGGNIGAATVVDQTGAVVPDKYQSFMRSTMRATAESHGRDTVVTGGDTLVIWHRDPLIAEAMVDPTIIVPGIVDSTKVLTFTAEEALRNNYCEGLAVNIPEALQKAGITNYRLQQYVPSAMDRFIGFLISPIVQGILIIAMIGGIYFELQTPGVGFPIMIAALAALLYFAPLYVEGLARHWEILLFVAGIVLVILEIFVIPGFGISGISGIALIVTGLTLSLVDNIAFRFEGASALSQLSRALFTVLVSVFISFALVIIGTKRFAFSKAMRGLANAAVQDHNEGYISIDVRQKEMIGKTGTAYTILRPSGLVEIDNEIFDARAEIGYIEKGEQIKVIRDEAGQLYVIKA